MTHSETPTDRTEFTRTEFTGHCLCGAIRFRGTYDDSHDLQACHCSQCRRWSGHVWAAILPSSLEISGNPKWYRASDFARRGFCADCGSSLFWQRDGSPIIDVAAGASGCNAQMAVGKESGSAPKAFKSGGRTIEIHSVSVSAISCSIRQGNVFGG